MVRAITENISGGNMVTTVLEHPSAYDAMTYYADKLGKELRVAKSDPVSGGVDVEEIAKLVDRDTCLLNVMYASNISGAKLDIENIVKRCREINPDLYILVLERDGLVERTVRATSPPQVDYALTPFGHSLSEPVRELAKWALANLDTLYDNRLRYDANNETNDDTN